LAVRITAGTATVIALVCVAGSAARAGSSAAAVARNVVVVSTTADVVNGDVSSLSALRAKPGRDGISLREALSAADKTGGSATVYIMFSAALNGKTIAPRTPLPPLRRDHLVLEGIAPNGSPARVTLDGGRAPLNTLDELLLVQRSEVVVRSLRFTGMNPTGNHTFQEPAIYVIGGQGFALTPGPTRRQLTNVQIVDDVFDSRGITFSGKTIIGPSGVIVFAGPNARMSGITIARNTFLHQTGNSDSVGVWANSSGANINDVLVENNTFDQDANAVELADTLRSPSLTGTRIIGNTITRGGNGIALDGNAMNGTIGDTLIEGNSVSDTQNPISLNACSFDPRLAKNAFGDVISNTHVVNNVIRQDSITPAIYIAGGNTTTCASRVTAVTIENDTLVETGTEHGDELLAEFPGARGNYISGVVLRNTIFYDPNGMPIASGTFGQPPNVATAQPPDVVANSLIWGPAAAGGNTTVDPHFANLAGGDYHLAAASPAINTGTTAGAPAFDRDGARRDAQPDIGAFEYGAAARPLLTVTVYPLGGGGTVTSTPAGISCGTECGAQFDANTTVTLAATPAKGSRFLGWQGACSGTRRCTVTLTANRSLTARFGSR
jgi:Divergent InlB B-repeat domain